MAHDRHPSASATAELRLFGGLHLGGVTEAPGPRATQRRPLAALAVLAAAGRLGVTREKLAALLWHDADDRESRRHLSDTLYAIRHDLADAAVSETGGTLVLDPRVVWSDAAAFDEAVAEGDLGAAAQLYRGAFLDGFHLRRAPAFEEWKDAEQRRYAAAYESALQTLARDAEAGGDHAGAARWWRYLLAHDPCNSRVVLAVMRALDRIGDPANALRHLADHRQVLQGELGVEPSPELLAYAEALRQRMERGGPAPHAPYPSSWVEAAAHTSSEHPEPARPEAAGMTPAPKARWRVPAGVAGALAIGAITVLAVRGAANGRGAGTALDPNLIAIAPFVTVGPNLALWQEATLDLLYYRLDGAGPLRAVEPARALRELQGGNGRPESSRLARATGAGLQISGAIFPCCADSVRLLATLVEARSGTVSGRFEVRGYSWDIPTLVDSVAAEVLSLLARSRGLAGAGLQSIGSSDPRAIREYLIGEQLYRRLQKDSAIHRFEHATRIDSSFALAYSRWASSWRLASRSADELMDDQDLLTWGRLKLAAGRLNHGLATRESLLLAIDSLDGALLVARAGSPGGYLWNHAPLVERLEATLRRAEEEYPNDPERQFRSGKIRWYWAPLIGSSRWESYQAAHAMIDADSAYLEAHDVLSDHLLIYDGIDEALAHMNAYLRRAPARWELTRQTTDLRHLLEHLASDPPAAWMLLDSLVQRRQGGDSGAARTLEAVRHISMWWPDEHETIARVARADEDWRLLAAALAFRGHLREADAVRRATMDGTPWSWASTIGERSAGGAVSLPDTAYRAAETALATATPGAFLHSQFLWALRGDAAFLRRLLGRWRALQRSGDRSAYRRAFELGAEPYVTNATEGYLALAEGDTTRALDLLARYRWPGTMSSECLVLGQLYAARRRYEAADDVFRRCQSRADQYPSAADVYLLLHWARVLEALGKTEDARREYRFVADAWRHADPELQGYVREAQSALERLSR